MELAWAALWGLHGRNNPIDLIGYKKSYSDFIGIEKSGFMRREGIYNFLSDTF